MDFPSPPLAGESWGSLGKPEETRARPKQSIISLLLGVFLYFDYKGNINVFQGLWTSPALPWLGKLGESWGSLGKPGETRARPKNQIFLYFSVFLGVF